MDGGASGTLATEWSTEAFVSTITDKIEAAGGVLSTVLTAALVIWGAFYLWRLIKKGIASAK